MAGLGQGKTYQYLARPIEELISGHHAEQTDQAKGPAPEHVLGSGYIDCSPAERGVAICDVLIVGTGYGGSVAARVLAGLAAPGQNRLLRVVMLERGREFAPGEFPESLGDLPGEVRFHRHEDNDFFGDADALFDFRINKDVSVLIANGLGGGSLINGNVALKPDNNTFKREAWPKELREPGALGNHFSAVGKLLGVMDPPEDSMPKKYWALKRLANSLNAVTQPAPVTIDLDSCTKCGNCNTGCNVGAKKTLPFTVLRQAQERGAEIYTGANVLTLHRCPDDQAWSVRFRRTATAKTILKREIFQLRAKIVILAAGTLGTTEILLRSAKDDLLPCSDKQLGKRFSTNGDMISFGYAGRHPVQATGKSSDGIYKNPGPTISGYASVSFGIGAATRPVVMQDSSVPLALNQIFGEIVTTGSLLARYVVKDRPAWFVDNRKENPDPLAVHGGAIANSQVVLTMGHDKANGMIELVAPKGQAEAKDDARVIVTWTDAWKDPVFDSLHEKFKEAYLKGGFDDGYYIPSPAWKSVPDGFEKAFTGGAPAGKLLTVHPLGGCVMADSAENGVVNHLGQVFKSNHGSDTYGDLYVMDGAIVPEALGINPFLTISALALRNGGKIREQIEKGGFAFEQIARPSDLGCTRTASYGIATSDPYSTKSLDERLITMEVRERLARFPGSLPMLTEPDQYCDLIDYANDYVKKQRAKDGSSPASSKDDERKPPFQKHRHYRLVLSIEATFDLTAFLANPEGTPLTGEATLSFDPSQWAPIVVKDAQGNVVKNDNCSSYSLFVEPIVADHLVPIACGKGRVGLLVRDDAKFGQQTKRWLQIARAACTRRSGDFSLKKLLENGSELSLTVSQHTHWRRFDYTLTFDDGPLAKTLGPFTLEGNKLLAYTENPWNALFKMAISFVGKSEKKHSVPLGEFHVDLNHLLKDGIPQVKQSPHMPATLMGVARFGLFALRAMFQTHLWSFGAPNYDKHEPLAPALPEAIALQSGKRCTFSVHRLHHRDLEVPPGKAFDVKPYVRLARYALEERRENSATRPHLLCIHGLAHGGAVFATPTIGTPMVAYFVEQGYVVWVLDHRLSPALEWQPHRRQVTMDHLAKTDIPLAVEYVYKAAGSEPIDVFAHCVGAGAFVMAALNGCLHDDTRKRSKISGATIHAVTPWLVPSPKNAANAKLAAFYKDSLRFDDPSEAGFDPIPPRETKTEKPDFFEVLIDRIAGSIPWIYGETEPHQRAHSDKHMSKAICNRMTLWYSSQWNHKNLSDRTHKEIATLVGFANLEVFRHIYFCILRERLTDREGSNIYLTVDNVKDYWGFDTMFIHGDDNQVFSPEGSRSSAWKLNKTIQLIKEKSQENEECYKRPNIWHCDVPHYGHMDIVFGENACHDVYPNVKYFFDTKFTNEEKDDKSDTCQSPYGNATIERNPQRGFHRALPSKQPQTGPILFDPQPIADSSDIKLGIWLEPTRNATSKPKETRMQKPGQTTQVFVPEEIQSKYEYGTYWLVEGAIPPNLNQIDVTVNYEDPLQPQMDNPNFSLAVASDQQSPSKEPCLRWRSKLSSKSKSNHLAFTLGSCRYPGSPFEKDASDRLFATMYDHAACKETDIADNALDFAMFVGDQIYADATANVFDTTEVVERYWERYRDALGSPNMKRLLKNLPTYFALDDHEFDDAWLGRDTTRIERDKENIKRYAAAMDAARSYQGMAAYVKAQDKNQFKFWHKFTSHEYPFFVMDTRTERKIRWAHTTPKDALIAYPNQWEELKCWLTAYPKSMPKFIACGSPLAPPLDETLRHPESWRNDDSWLGFPGSLASLVQFIVDNEIKNVVLLSGDLHLSAYAGMTFKAKEKGKTAQVHQIIASGLYVPLPFANTKERELGCGEYTIPGSDYMIEFGKAKILTTSPSHFVRVDVTCENGVHKINMQAYGNERMLGDHSICLTTD